MFESISGDSDARKLQGRSQKVRGGGAMQFYSVGYPLDLQITADILVKFALMEETVVTKPESAVELSASVLGATDHFGIGFLGKKLLSLMVRSRFGLMDLATV